MTKLLVSVEQELVLNSNLWYRIVDSNSAHVQHMTMMSIADIPRLEILLHPEDQIDCKPGSRIEFSIVLSETSAAASFQWYFQEKIIDADNSDYTGATEKVIVILECLSVHQGQYKCIVTDRSGKTRVNSKTARLVLGMLLI